MTKKQRTIRALCDLIIKYIDCNPTIGNYFEEQYCSLCDVHLILEHCKEYKREVIYTHNCIGCPLAYKSGTCGCSGQRSNWIAYRIYKTWKRRGFVKNLDWQLNADIYDAVFKAFHARAFYLSRVLKWIEGWPEKQFTKRGWIPRALPEE